FSGGALNDQRATFIGFRLRKMTALNAKTTQAPSRHGVLGLVKAHETARVHCSARRCGCFLAARSARAADRDAGDRFSQHPSPETWTDYVSGFKQGLS